MGAPYNLTNITATPGFNGLITGINGASGGLLGLTTWMGVFAIAFLGLLVRGNRASSSFAAGSFFSFLYALLMWTQGWVTDWILITNVIMMLGGIVIVSMSD